MRIAGYRKEGTLKVVAGNDPAAGAEFSVTVPNGVLWVVQSVRVTLVTDATAVTREMAIRIDDGSKDLLIIPSGRSQASNQGVDYNFVVDVDSLTNPPVSGNITRRIPRIPLLPGYRVRSVTANLQAGDNYGAPTLYVVEYSLL